MSTVEEDSTTPETTTSGVAVPRQRQPVERDAVPAERPSWRERLVPALFPDDPDEPRRGSTARRVLLAVAFVLAGTVLSLVRTGGHGPFDSVWAEDGSGLLYTALNSSTFDALTSGMNGYFVLLPRLIAEPTTILPLAWAPAVLSIGTAVCTAVFAFGVYLASGAYLHTWPLRLLVALPAVAAPVGGGVTPNNAATLQFVALYGVFWMLLWSPRSRAGRAFALTTVVMTGLTTILAAVFAPLALLRAVLRRDRWSVVLAAAVCGTAAIQVGALALGVTSREGLSRPRPDPVWAFIEWVLWGVPYSVLGERLLLLRPSGTLPHTALIAVAYLIVAGAVALALRRVTRPAWGLAVLAAAHSAMILGLSMIGMGYRVDTYLVPEPILMGTARYLVPTAALVIAALVALLRPRAGSGPRPGARAWPVLGYGLLVVLICALHLRADGPRNHVPSWSGLVADARAECVATGARSVRVSHGGDIWYPWIDVPCRYLVP